MREVSDALLLNIAEVSASLTGLFLVGVSSTWRRGFRRSHQARDVVETYFRSRSRPPGDVRELDAGGRRRRRRVQSLYPIALSRGDRQRPRVTARDLHASCFDMRPSG